MTSDASGNWGCGAWHLTEWFQLPWNEKSRELGIAAKELIPIIIGAVVWGSGWSGRSIRVRCDNAAVIAILNSRYSKEPLLMHMLRCLFFIEAQNQFIIRATHLAGAKNDKADDLSRGKTVILSQEY